MNDDFQVADRGFWKGQNATERHLFDSPLKDAIIKFFHSVGAKSVLELGAGMGPYSKELKAKGFFISCYDGNPNTQDLTDGLCAVLDFSKPINLTRHEWVLSLEVGEHIPQEFENIFLNNVDKGNEKGVIMSWAIEGQTGTSHVNNRNNSYIRSKFADMGYEPISEAEEALRTAATFSWFKNTIMVFKRKTV